MLGAFGRRGALSSSLLRPVTQQKSNIHSLSAPLLSGTRRPSDPYLFTITHDKPFYGERYLEWEILPRDEFGVPHHIPPDISTVIQHTYFVPPAYYPFIKKIGDDTPELKPWMDKLIKGQLTFADYEEMFYKNAKPLKVYRNRIPLPYRTDEEIKNSAEVMWESKWCSFRQRVQGEYFCRSVFRDFFTAILLGICSTQIWMSHMSVYNDDMRLFYLEAPEHKINWVVPRGDL